VTALITREVAREPAAVEPAPAAPRPGLGQVPVIVFLAAAGLLVCSVADTLSRATLAPSPLIYWVGIALICVPVLYRLLSTDASPGERLGLTCVLTIALYGVKVAREPFLFTIADEFIHSYNANQIDVHNHLFHPNSILEVSPYYPGLEGATSALMDLTGMSAFGAGLVLVGAARLTLAIGLFLLFRRISGSARTAGLGAALYAGNPNFLFFGAQYSYGSLALPLLVVVLAVIAERSAAPRAWAREWAVPIVLGIAAVVVTHHLSSYMLAATLISLALLYWYVQGGVRWPNPWRFALLATGLAAVWLTVVATSTLGYLTTPLERAFEDAWNTIVGESSPRTLFESTEAEVGSSDDISTPPVARAVALSSAVLLLAALPLGLLQVWRRYRAQPFALMFSAAAIGWFGVLGLRFAPYAWETGNRASEYLYIGLAFIAALAFVLAYSRLVGYGPRSRQWVVRGLLTALLGIVTIGGWIAGWQWDQHMAKPLSAEVDGRRFESEPLGLGRWVAGHLPGERFATRQVTARTLLDPGRARPVAGFDTYVEDILVTPTLESWQRPLLHRRNLRYVVSDRRRVSPDVTRGYFFTLRGTQQDHQSLLPKARTNKFEQVPSAARIFDSGGIVVFDLEAKR
jgi:hypothetical protein